MMIWKRHLALVWLIGIITSICGLPEKNWLGPEFGVVQKVYEDCQDKNDFVGCLKAKALVAIAKAAEQDSVRIVDGLVLEKQNTTEKESIIEGIADARTLGTWSALDKSLLEKTDKFLRTHVLKIDMADGVGRDGGGGGGGGDKGGYGGGGGGGGGHKDKKGGGQVKYVLVALFSALGIAGPLALKALAMIAGKALVISKVALTIAGIIALKKLFSHDHQEESISVHAGEHNRRNSLVVRPAKPAATLDPYRYYYEYH